MTSFSVYSFCTLRISKKCLRDVFSNSIVLHMGILFSFADDLFVFFLFSKLSVGKTDKKEMGLFIYHACVVVNPSETYNVVLTSTWHSQRSFDIMIRIILFKQCQSSVNTPSIDLKNVHLTTFKRCWKDVSANILYTLYLTFF